MIPTWIATRTLTDSIGDQIEVRIGVPEQVGPDEWTCPVSIGGVVSHGRGIDAFQALILAHEKIHNDLEQAGTFSWHAADGPGDTGFPRIVPMALGGRSRLRSRGTSTRRCYAAWTS